MGIRTLCLNDAILFDQPMHSVNHEERAIRWLRARIRMTKQDAREVDADTAGRSETPVSIFSVLRFKKKTPLDVETLYRKYAGTVARRVRRFVAPDEVEEVVHEVFLKAFERRDSFRGESSPVTWIYHIATNHCLNRIRDQKRRRLSLQINQDLPWLRPSSSADADSILLLEQLWSHMTEEQCLMTLYYFVDGLTHAEIARIMGVSRRTVGNRMEEISVQMRALSGDM